MTAADSFDSVIHWDQLTAALYKVSLSVPGSGGALWVIPLFTRLQEFIGPLRINMSHKQMTVLYRGGGQGCRGKKCKALVPLYLIPVYLSMHIQPCQCVYSVTAEALCHCSAVGFTSQTQTAKVTFEFPGVTTMLYLTGLIMFPPVCALQTRMDRPFGAFLFWSNEKVPGCKRFGSWRHLAAQIHCFFWAF